MRLPTFLLIGAAKSGTTSLHHYLAQHPAVFMSPVKEPGFFAFEGHDLEFSGPGDEWIKETVDTTIQSYSNNFSGVTTEQAIGESSPVYLYSIEAAGRIATRIPDARIIAILRNPVERAYSQFLFFVQCGREPLWDFGEALDQEESRIRANWAWGWHYKRLGFYHEQLTRYLDHFDRSQIKILLYEDLHDQPKKTVRRLYRFLDVDESFTPNLNERHNVTQVPRSREIAHFLRKPNPARALIRAVTTTEFRRRLATSTWLSSFLVERPPMPPDARQRLIQDYRTDILQLQDLIERDLTSWLT
jgi:hypothetical protein